MTEDARRAVTYLRFEAERCQWPRLGEIADLIERLTDNQRGTTADAQRPSPGSGSPGVGSVSGHAHDEAVIREALGRIASEAANLPVPYTQTAVFVRCVTDAAEALDRLTAGVSGGTPPSEPEKEQCQRCNSDDWTEWMDYRGCSDCRDLAAEDAEDEAAGLGGDSVAVGTDAELRFAASGALCKRSPRQPEGRAWTGPICACDASEWLECRRGTPTGSARLPEVASLLEANAALTRSAIWNRDERWKAHARVGLLEEALRGLDPVIQWIAHEHPAVFNEMPTSIFRNIAVARAALAGGTPPDTTRQGNTGDASGVVAEIGDTSGGSE